MIELKGIAKRYGREVVLTDISFSVEPKEFLCITGPSGAGKTTIMHMLMGAEFMDKGSIHIDGVKLEAIPQRALQLYRRGIGIIFQDYKLLLNRTVRENIALPLEIYGLDDATIQKRTDEVLQKMDLTKKADVLCHALSGGEKARTAIGRAIVHAPKIILADEPTGNLDPEESMNILHLLKEIHAMGTTIIFATHDTVLVDALKTRVIHIEGGVVTRDSIGTYARTQKKSVPVQSADAPKKKQSPTKKTGKIKIVSIGN